MSLQKFKEDYKNHLYKIWNKMSSGSYIPPPVMLVEIPKKGGGKRPLGIPTVADRIAQAVVAGLEKEVEPIFHEDSYGYRPGKSAAQAISTSFLREVNLRIVKWARAKYLKVRPSTIKGLQWLKAIS
jgi:RNA-directed DNA polymerase